MDTPYELHKKVDAEKQAVCVMCTYLKEPVSANRFQDFQEKSICIAKYISGASILVRTTVKSKCGGPFV